jgi:hypothetical protein
MPTVALTEPGRHRLWVLLRASDPSGPDVDALDRWVTGVQTEGWTRRDVHAVVWDVFDRAEGLSERTLDALGEFDTALVGWCSADMIVRFPGDPEGVAELTAHVRGGRWR